MVNWWFFIRLGWIIPLCILGIYVIFVILLLVFIDDFIDFTTYKTVTAKTPEEKKRYRNLLYDMFRIKLNLERIKLYLRLIFKIKK